MATKTHKEPKTRKEEISERLAEILKEHDGMESNIGMTNKEYWDLKAELRGE